MKPWEVVFVSGKGGAGKTTTVHLLSERLKVPHVLADADVEGANLHICAGEVEVFKEIPYEGGEKARVLPEACTGCGECERACVSGAIRVVGGIARVEEILCEGCGLCEAVCPFSAVRTEKRVSGLVRVVKTRDGKVLVYGDLEPGESNSGKLVSVVKSAALSHGLKERVPLVLVDGPPGVGCPTISAISGADGLVLVAESTPSGFHDAERVLRLSERFRTLKFKVLVLNKWREGVKWEREGEFDEVVRIEYSFGVEEHLRRGVPLPPEVERKYESLAKSFEEVLKNAGWSAGAGEQR